VDVCAGFQVVKNGPREVPPRRVRSARCFRLLQVGPTRSVFLYFKTKDQFLSTVITRTVGNMARLFRDLTRDCDDPAEAVLISIDAVSALMKDPEKSDVIRLFPQIFSELGRNQPLRKKDG
jgi:hypothetical protein